MYCTVIDFQMSDTQREIRGRIEAFILEKIIPYEKDPQRTSHGPNDDLRIEFNSLTQDAGLFAALSN